MLTIHYSFYFTITNYNSFANKIVDKVNLICYSLAKGHIMLVNIFIPSSKLRPVAGGSFVTALKSEGLQRSVKRDSHKKIPSTMIGIRLVWSNK